MRILIDKLVSLLQEWIRTNLTQLLPNVLIEINFKLKVIEALLKKNQGTEGYY